MADGSCVEGLECVRKDDSLLVNNVGVNVYDLKTMDESVFKTMKVKMSFYVETNSDENSDKCDEPIIGDSSVISSTDNKHAESSQNKDDIRKKRCTDRYDSSESSDSGVAVLSVCGSSSSDITEPGSPYSPSSSASEGAPGEGPRPPWVPAPCPPHTKAKRPRADKCTNLESLITKKLHKNAAMPTTHTEHAANYNNNVLVNTEQKNSNTQTSQHCCIQRSEDTRMPTSKVLNQLPQSNDHGAHISSIPKHIIHKAVPQQSVPRTGILDSKAKDDKINQIKGQQVRITEYYKSQMKPSNTLKRDYAALINRVVETKGKICVNGISKSGNEGSENLGNYLTYLSQTFNSKMPLNNLLSQKSQEPLPKSNAIPVTQSILKPELDKKPIPALNPILNLKPICSNGPEKNDTHRTIINEVSGKNKTMKEPRSRNTGSKAPSKRCRTNDGKKSVASKVSKGSQTGSVNMEISGISTSSNVITIDSKSVASETRPDNLNRHITLSAIHEHMRKVLLQSQSSELKNQANKVKTQSTNNISDRVPSVANDDMVTNSCNSISEVSSSTNVNLISDSANLQSSSNSLNTISSAPSVYVSSNSSVYTNSQVINTSECLPNKQLLNTCSTSGLSNVAVPSPPTVMLTTIRIPQANMQHSSLVNTDTSRTTPNHIAISPTKINGQFVLPVVQNINGALVQIPSIVTKVGQNTVLPLSSQNLLQRPENLINQQQATQMYFNGTLLKINTQMHTNLSDLIAKQMTAANATNVSYTVTQKNISNTVPGINLTNTSTAAGITSKPNFAMNLNPQMFVSSPGFILNPVTGMVTAQSNPSLPVQQPFGGNVVLTTPLHPGVHMNQNINNGLNGINVQPGNIPISPIKLGDISRVFLTPTRPVVQNMSVKEDPPTMCNTVTTSTPIVNERLELKTNVSQEPSVDISSQSADTTQSYLLDTKDSSRVESSSQDVKTTSIQQSNDNVSGQLSLSIDEKSKDVVIDSTSTEISNVDNDNSLFMNEETKTSIDSVSDELNCTSSNSIESCELSKDIDDDSLSTNQLLNENSNSCTKNIDDQCLPKTIRFPLNINHCQSKNKSGSRTESDESKSCMWNGCVEAFDDSITLLEHLQECHVNSQAGKETYTCLWKGCRVYNKSSCSRCWLERHVLSHGGTKLFRCIVDGCGQRFNTQLSLQRHVNNHFSESATGNANVKKTVESNGGAPKLIRRNGKKLRYRRQPWSARMFDFFDAGIMEGLQYRVVRSAAWRSGGHPGGGYSGERKATTVTLTATIKAKRYSETLNCNECLVTWTPANVLQDEWLPEKEFIPMKDIKISELDAAARNVLYWGFCSSYRHTNGHNNPKTDSLVHNTANTSESPRLTGAARRKQWRR